MPVALFCHILSHTPQVHNQKYQAKHLRHDMQNAAFGGLAGDNQHLFKHLGHAGKDYDPKAPIYMTVEQHEEAESRRDTTCLKSEIKSLQEHGRLDEARALRNKLTNHMRQLEKLAILARREAHFRDRASRLERGTPQDPPSTLQQGPDRDWVEARQRVKIDHRRLHVADLMRAWAPATVFDIAAEARALYAIAWLGNYLSQSTSAIANKTEPMTPLSQVLDQHGLNPGQDEVYNVDHDEELSYPHHPSHDEAYRDRLGRARLIIPPGKQAKCLICSKSFSKRSNLTKHALVHRPALARDFACPVCGTVTSSPSEFSNHVERAHGKEYAPAFNASPGPNMAATLDAIVKPPAQHISCAVCHCLVRADAILRHFNTCHVAPAPSRPAQASILDCLDCADARGLSSNAWFNHLAEKHELAPAEQCPFCDRFFQHQGLPPHIRRCHFDAALGPLSCPICLRFHGVKLPLPDYPTWRVHAAGHVAEPPAAATEVSGIKRSAAIASLAEADPASVDSLAKRPCYEFVPESTSPSLREDEALAFSSGLSRVSPRPWADASPVSTQASIQLCLSDAMDELSPLACDVDGGDLAVTIDPALWREWQAQERSAERPRLPGLPAEEATAASPLSSLAGSTVCASPIAATATDAPSPPLMDCIVVAVGPAATRPYTSPKATSTPYCKSVRRPQRYRRPGRQVLYREPDAIGPAGGVRRSGRLRKRSASG